MGANWSAPWHKASFDKFITDTLPGLLSERLPLSGYHTEESPDGIHVVRIGLALSPGQVETEFRLPAPDADGLFHQNGTPLVVVPLASDEHLSTATIDCVGEQLYALIEERLGEAPSNLPWDENLLRTWLPLDRWTKEFLAERGQALDTTNWTAERTHLRRIYLPEIKEVVTSDQFGLVCPFETPEGPNIGHVFSLSVGAEIRDGRIAAIDDRPEAALGLTASMVPFLEHNDANRQLFGVNMMRQWMIPPDPEPALVQTGNEVDTPGFWCGRNLLTAFISLGGDTYEDAIVVSESCAGRLGYPNPLQPGDKLSNRHGTKGTVSRIVPDDQMPHTSDGMSVDLVFSFLGMHTRLNFGQVREAVVGRIARAEGAPAIVPPFRAPSDADLRSRLSALGLPETGMEQLTLHGQELEQPSLVGWVYWGKTYQTSDGKVLSSLDGENGMRQGDFEYFALRDAGAFENLVEHFSTRVATRPDVKDLPARLAEGPVKQAAPPTPRFTELARRLAVAGIETRLDGRTLAFQLVVPGEGALVLATPLPHPWLPDRKIERIGAMPGSPDWEALVQSNDKLKRLIDGNAPPSLVDKAVSELQSHVDAFFKTLLVSDDLGFGDAFAFSGLRFSNRISFSGKAVLAPDADQRLDQVGIPEEMAWTFFSPLVTREIGAAEVRDRTKRAESVLDRIMAESWVLINRAPTFMPTCILAFHPTRRKEQVIRLHPLACVWTNGDFDGDQAAVFIPITEVAQKEAGERLSIAGHLRRDPALMKWLRPYNDALWGLARLSLTENGRRMIAEAAGTEIAAPEGIVNSESVTEALKGILVTRGETVALDAVDRLMRLGLKTAMASGASISPFIGETVDVPASPESDSPELWNAVAEELADRLAARTDYLSMDLGPQLLAAKSGARGSIRQLARLVGAHGVAEGWVAVRHGYREGLTADEIYARVPSARIGLKRFVTDSQREHYGLLEISRSKAFTVFARAMRSLNPGMVFARAAATAETDPLTDLDSRLFVGLPPLDCGA